MVCSNGVLYRYGVYIYRVYIYRRSRFSDLASILVELQAFLAALASIFLPQR